MYFRSQIFTYLIILLLGFNIDTIAQKSLDKFQNNFQNPPQTVGHIQDGGGRVMLCILEKYSSTYSSNFLLIILMYDQIYSNY